MNNGIISMAMDEALPDRKVIADIRLVLEDINSRAAYIELDENEVAVPADVSVTIVTKAFFKEYFDKIGFGTYKVMVSVGTPIQKKSGVLEPQYCFSTLYYNEDAELITLDFHSEMR